MHEYRPSIPCHGEPLQGPPPTLNGHPWNPASMTLFARRRCYYVNTHSSYSVTAARLFPCPSCRNSHHCCSSCALFLRFRLLRRRPSRHSEQTRFGTLSGATTNDVDGASPLIIPPKRSLPLRPRTAFCLSACICYLHSCPLGFLVPCSLLIPASSSQLQK